jgi:hypothetical protein
MNMVPILLILKFLAPNKDVPAEIHSSPTFWQGFVIIIFLDEVYLLLLYEL